MSTCTTTCTSGAQASTFHKKYTHNTFPGEWNKSLRLSFAVGKGRKRDQFCLPGPPTTNRLEASMRVVGEACGFPHFELVQQQERVQVSQLQMQQGQVKVHNSGRGLQHLWSANASSHSSTDSFSLLDRENLLHDLPGCHACNVPRVCFRESRRVESVIEEIRCCQW